MNEYAIYLRKSRADAELEKLGEGETLARHQAILEQLARRNNIPTTAIDYYREIVSGESIADRPQVQALLRAVSNRQYKAVLVVEIERLARGNTSDQGAVADAFLYSNTQIITPVKTYNPNNPQDLEYFEFGLFMSRREYQTIKRRLEAGKQQAVMEGNWIGRWVPYGYKLVKTGRKHSHLEIVDDEAEIVREIYRRYVDGESPGAIGRDLTLRGIPTVRGGRMWGETTIKRILTNPVYLGKTVWSKTRLTRVYDAESNTTVKRRLPNTNPIVVDGTHEAIITELNSRQAPLNASSPLRGTSTLTTPYAGLIACSKCHYALRHSKPSSHDFYARYKHDSGRICDGLPTIRADALDDAIINALKGIIKDTEIKAKTEDKSPNTEREISALKRAKTKAETGMKRIYSAFENGTYSQDEFIQRRAELQAKISQIDSELAAMTNLPKPKPPAEIVSSLHKVIESISNPSIPAAAKNKFLKRFIRKIWASYDKATEQYRIEIELL